MRHHSGGNRVILPQLVAQRKAQGNHRIAGAYISRVAQGYRLQCWSGVNLNYRQIQPFIAALYRPGVGCAVHQPNGGRRRPANHMGVGNYQSVRSNDETGTAAARHNNLRQPTLNALYDVRHRAGCRSAARFRRCRICCRRGRRQPGQLRRHRGRDVGRGSGDGGCRQCRRYQPGYRSLQVGRCRRRNCCGFSRRHWRCCRRLPFCAAAAGQQQREQQQDAGGRRQGRRRAPSGSSIPNGPRCNIAYRSRHIIPISLISSAMKCGTKAQALELITIAW